MFLDLEEIMMKNFFKKQLINIWTKINNMKYDAVK